MAARIWWSHRCPYCKPPLYRSGQVPIHGSVHKACKNHALEHGHYHGKPIDPPPKKGASE